jgi:hypothetical protein
VSTSAALAYWLGNPLLNPAVLVFLLFVHPGSGRRPDWSSACWSSSEGPLWSPGSPRTGAVPRVRTRRS